MKNLLIIFILVISSTSLSQKKNCLIVNCDEHFVVLYRITEFKNDKSENYYMSFEAGFNDTLEVYINGDLICTKKYKTNPSLGTTGITLKFSNKKKNPVNIIHIKSTTRNHCLEFSIDERFRIMYIGFEKEKWSVTYSNEFTIYE